MSECIDILLAEDDAQVRRFLRRLLEREGYSIAEAVDGPSAVDLAQRHRPRCILVDIAMPGMDGLAVTRALRRNPQTSQAQIHCLTGSNDPLSREEAHKAGCNQFLIKPLKVPELLLAIRPLRGIKPSLVGDLGLMEAQDLLDWMERHGCSEMGLDVQANGLFAVHCICPSGLQLRPLACGRVQLVPA
jgi:CheY-like chemotaxis protein